MTYYHTQILKLRDEFLPKQYLIDRVVKAKQVIDSRFCSQTDLDYISGEAFLSKFHLLRLFKICYGKTPYQQITDKRIAKAETLLGNGASVSETCHEIGFESPASFCIFFRKHFGETPTGFIKKQFLISKYKK